MFPNPPNADAPRSGAPAGAGNSGLVGGYHAKDIWSAVPQSRDRRFWTRGLFCTADFQVCCIAGFQTRRRHRKPALSILERSADLEIGDTAGWKPAVRPAEDAGQVQCALQRAHDLPARAIFPFRALDALRFFPEFIRDLIAPCCLINKFKSACKPPSANCCRTRTRPVSWCARVLIRSSAITKAMR